MRRYVINAYVKLYQFIFLVVAYLTVYDMEHSMIFTNDDPTFTRGAHYRSGFLVLTRLNFNACIDKKSHVRQSVK